MEDPKLEALKKRLFEQYGEDSGENAVELCDHLTNWFATKATSHKKRYKTYRNLALILVTIASILSILDLAFYNKILNWSGAIISVLAATFTSFLTVTNSQKDWINSRTASQKFQTEKFLFLQESGIYNISERDNRIKLFSKNIVKLWDRYHSNWAEIKSD